MSRSDAHAYTCRWHHIRHEPGWQDGAFIGLACAYALLATIALVQLLRISRRCPQYGWTTQKVFHLLNLLVCALRAIIMLLHTEFAVRPCPLTCAHVAAQHTLFLLRMQAHGRDCLANHLIRMCLVAPAEAARQGSFTLVLTPDPASGAVRRICSCVVLPPHT